MKVLLAGDHFVRVDIMARALKKELPDAETSELMNDWPETPMGDIGTVHEAQGDEDAIIEALQGVDVMFNHTQPVTPKILEACPDLKMVSVTRGGPVNVDIEAATKQGVIVTNAPGRNMTATAEHSIGMILAAVRQIPARHDELRRGEWRGNYYNYDEVGPEVRGSTVGIVGYGNIGRQVAKVMQAMGARIVAFDPFVDPTSVPEGIEVFDDLDEMLKQTNILTLHARVSKENTDLINAERIALMPRGAILVNCARPPLLDYDAMCDALESGQLYAAACDVLPSEPLPEDSRLLSVEGLIITPHLAGASKASSDFAAAIVAADIAKFARGERPDHIMNPEVLG